MSYGYNAYLEAVEHAFGADVDYAMPVKLFGTTGTGEGKPSQHPRSAAALSHLGVRPAVARAVFL